MLWFKSHRNQITIGIWLFGILVGGSQLYISEPIEFTYGKEGYCDCRERWTPGSLAGRFYTLFVFGITFVIPIIVLSVVYSLLGFSLMRHKLPGEEAKIQQDFNQKKNKVS